MKFRTRRKFSLEFKMKAVELSLKSYQPVAAVARELGIHPVLLSQWRRKFTMSTSDKKPLVENKGPDKSMKALEKENAKLKKQLERAQLELDILKKLEEFASKQPR